MSKYVKLSKEDWRQKYNKAREEFMRKNKLTAGQVAPRLSKADVRGISAQDVRRMSSLFTKPEAVRTALPSGEEITKSAVDFQHLMLETINVQRAARIEALKKEPFIAKGKQRGTVEMQMHMDRFRAFEPLKMRDYKSLEQAQKYMRKLKGKLYDATKDVRFRDAFLKAIWRSGMSEQDKYDITMAIKEMDPTEVAKMAMTHKEFEIVYVYNEVYEANEVRANRLREYLGIAGKNYDAGLLSKSEQGYYEGINTKSGRMALDETGNVILQFDKAKIEARKHGRYYKPTTKKKAKPASWQDVIDNF